MTDCKRPMSDSARAIFGVDSIAIKGGFLLCTGCRERGSCQFGITGEEVLEDGKLRTFLRCAANFAGGPDVAHGGWTSAVLDEMLGHIAVFHNSFAVTSSMTVKYHRPVPVERDLVGYAWIDRREGENWHLIGEIRLSEPSTLLARATALFIERDFGHYQRHEEWLDTHRGVGGFSKDE